MFKVTIVYISNVEVTLFLEGGSLTAKEKKALLKVTADFIKKGEIISPITRTHEFSGKKVSHCVLFKNRDAYQLYLDAQERAVPGYLLKRNSYYEAQHVAINEKGVDVED